MFFVASNYFIVTQPNKKYIILPKQALTNFYK